ncbi:hypothetical protein SMTE4_37890 [Serratia marcescens]|nr:hypothetical protein SMTE4_37890 [Serratia marcescens]
MAILQKIKELFDLSSGFARGGDGVVNIEFAIKYDVYEFLVECSQSELISSIFQFPYNNDTKNRTFQTWDTLPEPLKNGTIASIFVEMNLKELRKDGIHVYYDERELVELCPISPKNFIILALSLNGGKCTVCPDEYNKNEILRYSQIKRIWELLTSCSDDERGGELIFLYKQKISIELKYTIEDLGFDFDGLAKLERIFSDGLHSTEKKNIMQNTLRSFLWRERKENGLRKLLRDFTLFSLSFEEDYRSFSVGFSFDKIRKEYTEKFRDYLSKLNSILYDTLTRSLSIPVSGLISFVAMKEGDSQNIIVNCAAIMLTIFTSVSIHYLVFFQKKMVMISKKEYKELFKTIRIELKDLELLELNEKELSLNTQSNKIINILNFIYATAISSLILNGVMFIMKSF